MNGQTKPPAPDAAYPLIIAANGPKMRAHLGASADHVILMPPGGEFTAGVSELEEFGPALADIA
jgi:hypothetical protein